MSTSPLPQADIDEILRLRDDGLSPREVGRRVRRDTTTCRRYMYPEVRTAHRAAWREGKARRKAEAAAAAEITAPIAGGFRNITRREWLAETRLPRWHVLPPGPSGAGAWTSPMADLG